MLQKTFEISTKEEAAGAAETLRGIPETATASRMLLQVYVFCFSYDETMEMISPVLEAFPGLVVSGMTMFSANPPDADGENLVFDERPLLRLGFYFFESARVRLLSFEIDDKDPDNVVEAARREIASTPDIRGVGITLSGFAQHTSRMLGILTAGFEEIPFFGTMADVNYISERQTEPFIFNNERKFTHGVIFVLFSGPELHIEAQYIFGWIPVGKAMTLKLSDCELTFGDSVISLMDGMPPEKIYHKYLGIRMDEFLTINCCEFPLVVERDGLLIGRTPYCCDEKGELVFIGSIRPEESVRFSYTVRSDLIKNTETHSLEMREFAPQAMELFICGNRGIMLRKDSSVEIDCFRRFAPELQYCSAAGEIYFHRGRGDLLNSALVAIGMREGEPHVITENAGTSCKVISAHSGGVVPLSERVMTFMRSMSGDVVEYARDAQRANKAKSDFLANMSHDIRTPINAVLGMNEMVLRESGDENIIAYSENIRTAGNTLLGLINDILDFSKIESGKLDLIPVDYDLASVLNDLVNMIQTRADAKGLALRLEIDENIPKLLHGDEIRIKQIITNILTNAVKYTEKGSVTFSMGFEHIPDDVTGIMLKVAISDTGIGIRQEDIPKLFTEFERIEESRNRSIEGTELGMNITQRLLALMGSSLDVQSEYGKGSVFSFAVKQQVVKWEPVGDYEEAFRRSVAGRKKYRERFTAPDANILVIDDTPMNLQVFKSLLKATLVRIDTAESGDEGLALARKNRYDIIFIDHMMPHKDGIETLEELKAGDGINSDTPTVCLTANAISGAREQYLAAGFDDYLTKPIESEKLERMIMEYLPGEKLVQTSEPVTSDRQANVVRSTVLVVDDDELIRRTAEKILKPHYTVICTDNGKAAAETAERERPDLVLLDINLGGMDGFEVLRLLKSSDTARDIPVMFITGDTGEETEVRGFREGASDYVRKPFVPEVLLQRTKRVIDLYHYQSGLISEVGRQTARADRLSLEMMIALSKTVDAKDHYTNGHSGRVAEYSAEIARRMGKSEAEQEKIYEMGLMHDIGKIGVSEEIINKASRLTDEEFAQIKKHTVIGSDILSAITEMPDLAVGARSHHERYNGTGYPDGLSGKDIPEAARIICVADCYDAMTSTRTYSSPKTQEAVRAEIERCSGTQFDPDIAAVMIRMIDDDREYMMNEKGGAHVWKNRDKLWNVRPKEPDVPEEAAETPLPEQLYGIGEIDTEQGVLHCGNNETYLETLAIYADSVTANADEIENYLANGDLKNATVKIHALKSTSRVVGAMELGALAERLEKAGNENDAETVNAGVGELLSRYRALGEKLSSPIARDDDSELPLITDGELNDAYTLIREFLSVADYDSALQVIDGISGYSFPENEKDRFAKLKKAAAEVDYDTIAKILA